MRSLIVLIILVFNVNVYADEIDRSKINDSLQSIQSTPLIHGGKEGVWFPKESADLLLDLVQNQFKRSLDIIDAQTVQINSLKEANAARKLSAEEYEKIATFNKQMFDTMMEHMPNLVPPPLSWYETSTAFYIYGVLTGALVIVLSSVVLDNVIQGGIQL